MEDIYSSVDKKELEKSLNNSKNNAVKKQSDSGLKAAGKNLEKAAEEYGQYAKAVGQINSYDKGNEEYVKLFEEKFGELLKKKEKYDAWQKNLNEKADKIRQKTDIIDKAIGEYNLKQCTDERFQNSLWCVTGKENFNQIFTAVSAIGLAAGNEFGKPSEPQTAYIIWEGEKVLLNARLQDLKNKLHALNYREKNGEEVERKLKKSEQIKEYEKAIQEKDKQIKEYAEAIQELEAKISYSDNLWDLYGKQQKEIIDSWEQYATEENEYNKEVESFIKEQEEKQPEIDALRKNQLTRITDWFLYAMEQYEDIFPKELIKKLTEGGQSASDAFEQIKKIEKTIINKYKDTADKYNEEVKKDFEKRFESFIGMLEINCSTWQSRAKNKSGTWQEESEAQARADEQCAAPIFAPPSSQTSVDINDDYSRVMAFDNQKYPITFEEYMYSMYANWKEEKRTPTERAAELLNIILGGDESGYGLVIKLHGDADQAKEFLQYHKDLQQPCEQWERNSRGTDREFEHNTGGKYKTRQAWLKANPKPSCPPTDTEYKNTINTYEKVYKENRETIQILSAYMHRITEIMIEVKRNFSVTINNLLKEPESTKNMKGSELLKQLLSGYKEELSKYSVRDEVLWFIVAKGIYTFGGAQKMAQMQEEHRKKQEYGGFLGGISHIFPSTLLSHAIDAVDEKSRMAGYGTDAMVSSSGLDESIQNLLYINMRSLRTAYVPSVEFTNGLKSGLDGFGSVLKTAAPNNGAAVDKETAEYLDYLSKSQPDKSRKFKFAVQDKVFNTSGKALIRYKSIESGNAVIKMLALFAFDMLCFQGIKKLLPFAKLIQIAKVRIINANALKFISKNGLLAEYQNAIKTYQTLQEELKITGAANSGNMEKFVKTSERIREIETQFLKIQQMTAEKGLLKSRTLSEHFGKQMKNLEAGRHGAMADLEQITNTVSNKKNALKALQGYGDKVNKFNLSQFYLNKKNGLIKTRPTKLPKPEAAGIKNKDARIYLQSLETNPEAATRSLSPLRDVKVPKPTYKAPEQNIFNPFGGYFKTKLETTSRWLNAKINNIKNWKNYKPQLKEPTVEDAANKLGGIYQQKNLSPDAHKYSWKDNLYIWWQMSEPGERLRATGQLFKGILTKPQVSLNGFSLFNLNIAEAGNSGAKVVSQLSQWERSAAVAEEAGKTISWGDALKITSSTSEISASGNIAAQTGRNVKTAAQSGQAGNGVLGFTRNTAQTSASFSNPANYNFGFPLAFVKNYTPMAVEDKLQYLNKKAKTDPYNRLTLNNWQTIKAQIQFDKKTQALAAGIELDYMKQAATAAITGQPVNQQSQVLEYWHNYFAAAANEGEAAKFLNSMAANNLYGQIEPVINEILEPYSQRPAAALVIPLPQRVLAWLTGQKYLNKKQIEAIKKAANTAIELALKEHSPTIDETRNPLKLWENGAFGNLFLINLETELKYTGISEAIIAGVMEKFSSENSGISSKASQAKTSSTEQQLKDAVLVINEIPYETKIGQSIIPSGAKKENGKYTIKLDNGDDGKAIFSILLDDGTLQRINQIYVTTTLDDLFKNWLKSLQMSEHSILSIRHKTGRKNFFSKNYVTVKININGEDTGH
ncbi:MAG: hypothetical protein LBL61_03635, partial [Elusimicrobiota bacterium]|nr:hypothetical protein [Elusimicrobiota bacterium]